MKLDVLWDISFFGVESPCLYHFFLADSYRYYLKCKESLAGGRVKGLKVLFKKIKNKAKTASEYMPI